MEDLKTKIKNLIKINSKILNVSLDKITIKDKKAVFTVKFVNKNKTVKKCIIKNNVISNEKLDLAVYEIIGDIK